MTCPVRLRAAATVDVHGNYEADWTAPHKLTLPSGVFAPVKATEANELGREGVTIGWVLIYNDRHVDVEANDRIQHQGETYLVDGDPARYVHYKTGRNVMEIQLTRVVG